MCTEKHVNLINALGDTSDLLGGKDVVYTKRRRSGFLRLVTSGDNVYQKILEIIGAMSVTTDQSRPMVL